jgi:preprotein translocase subunit SecD
MNLVKNWRIVALVVFVVLSVLLVGTKGLSFGIDFTGGTELKMELEEGGEQYADAVVTILKNRLNGLGLKSTQVLKEADGRHITIKVSSTEPSELANLKDVINQQAVFEQMVEGEICAAGDEIQLDISQQGGALINGLNWVVHVKNTGDAPERCGRVMEGKTNRMTDIFLDRPGNSFMLIDKDVCDEWRDNTFKSHDNDNGYTYLSFIEDRARIPVICYPTGDMPPEENEPANDSSMISAFNITVVTNETKEDPKTLDEVLDGIQEQADAGKASVITLIPAESLPAGINDKINASGLSVILKEKGADQPFHINRDPDSLRPDNTNSWIDSVTGLKSTLQIQSGLTDGNPIYSSQYTGGSTSVAEAREIVERYKIWLTSGNLPVKARIVLERPNLPELGAQFLKYAGIIALIAIVLVASIVSIRYRHPKISIAILITSFSEIILILGFASLSSWELDLAAMAGIIAAIGTGVDHQIIITDETLRGERGKKDSKIWDVKQAINRAFFIIFTSAATTISAMLPLMSIIDLKGFAFTSIVGVLIGIMITRPAYSKIVEHIV